MTIKTQKIEELLQIIRCEDLPENSKIIEAITVIGEFERTIIDSLKGFGAHLLEGSRGTGKSMLLKKAEVEMDAEFSQFNKLAVYVTFKTSTLLEGVKLSNQKDAFPSWIGLNILEALYEKMLKIGLISYGEKDPFCKLFNLPNNSTSENIKWYLKEAIKDLKTALNSTVNSDKAIIAEAGDPKFLLSVLKDVMKEADIKQLNLLFDEAAHTFIPSQQEIFFEIFKLLHGDSIAVKAAVYPMITSYGRNFEIGQDARRVSMDKFEISDHALRETNRKFFREMLEKRISSTLKKKLFNRGQVLDLCIDISNGNPRSFLLVLNRSLDKKQELKLDAEFTEDMVFLAVKEYAEQELVPYHENLSRRLPKYRGHVKVGMNIINHVIIPEITEYNRRNRKNSYQSIWFSLKDENMSADFRLAMDILLYSGVLSHKTKIVLPKDKKPGTRYMVHLALLVSNKAFPIFSNNLTEAVKNIDLKLSSSAEISTTMKRKVRDCLDELEETFEKCNACSSSLITDAIFCHKCGLKVELQPVIGSLRDEPTESLIEPLSISPKIKAKIQQNFPLVGDLLRIDVEELKNTIAIDEQVAIVVINTAEEFISG